MSNPFRIAALTTEYRQDSHADVIVSRWIEPRPTDALYDWKPKTQIASIYVDQTPANDTSEAISKAHGIPKFDTIEGALTLGGNSLAVDAVLLIAEHGDYPSNAFGQKLYPRKELFDEVLRVFRKYGRKVPLFFDKHLSWNPVWAHEMYQVIQEEELPFFGGSSIVWNPRVPDVSIPPQAKISEVVAIYWNVVEAYLFHSFEYVASLIENRLGGEPGIQEIIAWQDEGVWKALEQNLFSRELLEEAAGVVSPESRENLRAFIESRGTPVYAFQAIHRDGLKVTHFMQKDLIRKWTAACRLEDPSRIVAGYSNSRGADHFHPHFARLNCQIQDFFLSGKPPISLDRLYLTTQATGASMRALAQPGCALATPEITFPVPDQYPESAWRPHH